MPVVRGINNKILHSSSEGCLTSHYLNLEENKRVLFSWGAEGRGGKGVLFVCFVFLSFKPIQFDGACDVRRT